MADKKPSGSRFQRYRARKKAADEERERELKRLKEFEKYMKQNHPELVVAYEMQRRLERDDDHTLGMDAVDDYRPSTKKKKNLKINRLF